MTDIARSPGEPMDDAELIAELNRLFAGLTNALDHLDDTAQQIFNTAEQLGAAAQNLVDGRRRDV